MVQMILTFLILFEIFFLHIKQPNKLINFKKRSFSKTIVRFCFFFYVVNQSISSFFKIKWSIPRWYGSKHRDFRNILNEIYIVCFQDCIYTVLFQVLTS